MAKALIGQFRAIPARTLQCIECIIPTKADSAYRAPCRMQMDAAAEDVLVHNDEASNLDGASDHDIADAQLMPDLDAVNKIPWASDERLDYCILVP